MKIEESTAIPIFGVLINRETGPLTALQMSGLSAALGQQRWVISAWTTGCFIGVASRDTARQLSDRALSVVADKACAVTVFQMGADLVHHGNPRSREAAAALLFLLEKQKHAP